MRQADYPIEKLLLNRWSSRRLAETPVSHDQLLTLLEAGRWAPSSYNDQPWRFIYAEPSSRYWQSFYDLLAAANQAWVGTGATLVVVAANHLRSSGDTPNLAASFDAGAAVENMAIQAQTDGLLFHVMGGFDSARAAEAVSLPAGYKAEVMLVIGQRRPDNPGEEPEIMHGRKSLAEIAAEGKFEFLANNR